MYFSTPLQADPRRGQFRDISNLPVEDRVMGSSTSVLASENLCWSTFLMKSTSGLFS